MYPKGKLGEILQVMVLWEVACPQMEFKRRKELVDVFYFFIFCEGGDVT